MCIELDKMGRNLFSGATIGYKAVHIDDDGKPKGIFHDWPEPDKDGWYKAEGFSRKIPVIGKEKLAPVGFHVFLNQLAAEQYCGSMWGNRHILKVQVKNVCFSGSEPGWEFIVVEETLSKLNHLWLPSFVCEYIRILEDIKTI